MRRQRQIKHNIKEPLLGVSVMVSSVALFIMLLYFLIVATRFVLG